MKTAHERWLETKDQLLQIAIFGDDGPDDPWVWKVLFWWATPDLWDDEIDTEKNT